MSFVAASVHEVQQRGAGAERGGEGGSRWPGSCRLGAAHRSPPGDDADRAGIRG